MGYFVGALAIALGLVHLANAVAWIRRTEGETGSKARRGPLSDPAMLQVPIWARTMFGLGGLIVAIGGVLILLNAATALWVYASGWVLVQGFALYNGMKAYGNLKWSHHAVRFLIFGAIFALGLFTQ